MIIRGTRNSNTAGPARVTITREDGTTVPLELPPVSRNEFRHSPDGFQWGYSGSGPAELARAILLAVAPKTDERYVRHPRCYQLYKNDVIAQITGDTFERTSREVLTWLIAWKSNHQEFMASIDEEQGLLHVIEELDAAEARGDQG